MVQMSDITGAIQGKGKAKRALEEDSSSVEV
jgi:hypothetical protein